MITMSAVESQPGPQSPPPPPMPQREVLSSNGRVRVEGLTETDRNFAIAMHLSPLAGFLFPIAFCAPLVLWLVRKDRSAFNDDHGREIVNFMISVIVLSVISCITLIGIPFVLVIAVVAVVNPIRAALAASRGEYFRYPMTFRFL